MTILLNLLFDFFVNYYLPQEEGHWYRPYLAVFGLRLDLFENWILLQEEEDLNNPNHL
jgi:hypothetical protein